MEEIQNRQTLLIHNFITNILIEDCYSIYVVTLSFKPVPMIITNYSQEHEDLNFNFIKTMYDKDNVIINIIHLKHTEKGFTSKCISLYESNKNIQNNDISNLPLNN